MTSDMSFCVCGMHI